MSDWIHETARAFAVELVAKCEESEMGLPIPLVWMEDLLIHTDDHPFCEDMECPCHRDSQRIYQYVPPGMILDGLMTIGELDRLYEGRSI